MESSGLFQMEAPFLECWFSQCGTHPSSLGVTGNLLGIQMLGLHLRLLNQKLQGGVQRSDLIKPSLWLKIHVFSFFKCETVL